MQKKTIVKKLWNLLIKIIISLLVVLSTTYGWSSDQFEEADPVLVSRLKEIVETLSEAIGIRNYAYEDNLNQSAKYIISQFQSLGYEVSLQKYEVKGQVFKNIIAEMRSEQRNQDLFIVGAHYDSCFNPGADDNASGVAGLIEMARLVKGKKFKYRVQFVAFTNEEPPFFQTDMMGSRVYTRSLIQNNEKVTGAIVLEMIGFYSDKKFSQRYPPLLGPFYPNKGDYVAVVGNFDSKKLVNSMIKQFKQFSNFPIESIVAPSSMPGLNFSDHWSFWQEGIPAVMVTDTAYMRNKHYHQETDLPRTLDYQKMALVITGLTKSLINLVNK